MCDFNLCLKRRKQYFNNQLTFEQLLNNIKNIETYQGLSNIKDFEQISNYFHHLFALSFSTLFYFFFRYLIVFIKFLFD